VTPGYESDRFRLMPPIREDLGIEESESDSPIRVPGRKRLNCLLCILLRASQITAEEIAMDTLINGFRVSNRRGAASGQGHRCQESYGEDGGIVPPRTEAASTLTFPWVLHPSSARTMEI
jgi:hypothetical protein